MAFEPNFVSIPPRSCANGRWLQLPSVRWLQLPSVHCFLPVASRSQVLPTQVERHAVGPVPPVPRRLVKSTGSGDRLAGKGIG
jgi:hypothetical protein